jgi:AcrR family transcriptional regulator
VVSDIPGEVEPHAELSEDFRSRTARRKRRTTRGRLIEALFRMVDQGQLDRANIDVLRGEVGLSRGAFYRYFTTLDDMLFQVSGAIGAQINAEMAERFGGEPDAARRISRHIRYFITRASADRACAMLLLRTLPLSGTVSDYARQRATADFEQAQADGRFDLQSIGAAVELGHGMGLAMLRQATFAGFDSERLSASVTIMLRGFGVPGDEARQLASEPLPPLAEASLRETAVAALLDLDTV